jgi:putative membrane protein
MEYPLVNAVVYTIVGVVLFLAAFLAAGRWFPFDLRKEIIQERNVAAAIIIAGIAIGLAIIIAATMH